MINEEEYNGVKLGKKPTDYIGGKDIELDILVEDWETEIIGLEYKLEHELQTVYNFETYACTVFSGNDAREPIFQNAIKNNLVPKKDILWLTANRYFKNGYINFDDRVPAMHAEIEHGVGTYQHKSANALRKWSLPEGILKDVPKNLTEYLDKSRITEEAIKLQTEFEKRFVWNWFWFNEKKDIKEQLKASPAMSIVRYANGEGCLAPAGKFNHAVMEYAITEAGCSKIDDNYNQRFKKYNKDYITSRLGFKLTIKNNIKTMQVENNKLYILVEGKEQKLAMGLDGKLWIYDEKIDTVLNSASRSGKYQIPKTVTLEEWNSVDRVNGKGEPIA